MSAAISIAALSMMSACSAGQPTVVEKLDEKTAVTITYGRTTMSMTPDIPYDRETERDYVQIGAIEINRMGTLAYYLWLGITDVNQIENGNTRPEGFDSIVLSADGEKIQLDVLGWSAETIGTSKPVYKDLFSTSVGAYYRVTLDEIQLLADSDSLLLHTTGSPPKEFIPSFGTTAFRGDLTEFLRVVKR